MKRSADYHDYVFKHGKLVGKFDEMYKYSKKVPWSQDKTAYSMFSNIDIAILKCFKYESICDIGCGLGYFTKRLYQELSSNGETNPKVTGIDISQIAIEKAKKLFPEISFIKEDLLQERPSLCEYFELVVIKENFWYVCHKLTQFLQNAISLIKKNGFLYVSQSFPETEKWVGQEIIDSPEKLRDILSQYTRPIHYCVEYEVNLNKRPLLHYLGKVQRDEDK